MSPKKICIPIQDKPRGGMYSFLRTFRKYLAEHGIPVTDEMADDYDILFVNSFMVSFKAVFRARRRLPEMTVVQRVDGSARDYGRYDDADKRQARANLLADITIFQSLYSKFSTTEKYKIIAQDGPIFYNPVDVQVFCPDGPRLPLDGAIRVCNASFSTNIRKGTGLIGTLAIANPDIDFYLCGRYPELPDLPNIHQMGHLDHKDLSAVMRSCHVGLHLAENDPCPNVVLEALASGLPVLYRDGGGTPELVGDGCGLPVTKDTFREQLQAVLACREEYSQAARTRVVTHFAPEVIFPQYLAAMDQAKRNRKPLGVRFLQAAVQGYQVI